jgi:hypothetical protein
MIPAGMIRIRGMFDTIEYSYKGVRIKQGTGSYSSRYDFYIGEHTPANRILCSTLVEAAAHINARKVA